MSWISYHPRDYALSIVDVKFMGNKVGEIRKEESGYRYFPKRARVGGELYMTLAACKKSLEAA